MNRGRLGRISPYKIMVLMDSEQPLRLRYAIAMSMLPHISAALNTEAVVGIDVGQLIYVVEQYISTYDLEGPKILEETCRKHFGSVCNDLPPQEIPNIPLKMLSDGVSFDIVVETMAILYSTLAYMLNIVAPEEYGKLLTRGVSIEDIQQS
jgi:hypothetical protein